MIGYDEFLDESGNVRPAWSDLADAVGDRGRAGMSRLRSAVRRLVDNDDITYTGVDPTKQPVAGGHDESRPWLLDTLPLVVSAADWDVLETGLVQRSRVLNAVLADLYGDRRSLTEGVLPPELLFAHPGYVRVANGIEVPGHHQLFMHACDVSRRSDGSFQVNADWTQAPSGAGYALADRRVLAHALPDLYEKVATAADDTVRSGVAAGTDRRGTRRCTRPGRGRAQPGHLLRDLVRSGVSRDAAGFPAGGERGSGGSRRQIVDALAGHAQTRRRGLPPRRCHATPTRSICAPTRDSAWSAWWRHSTAGR